MIAGPSATDHPRLRDAVSTDALPIAPALGISREAASTPRRSTLVETRVLWITAIVLGRPDTALR